MVWIFCKWMGYSDLKKDLHTNKCLQETYTPGGKEMIVFLFSVRLDFGYFLSFFSMSRCVFMFIPIHFRLKNNICFSGLKIGDSW